MKDFIGLEYSEAGIQCPEFAKQIYRDLFGVNIKAEN